MARSTYIYLVVLPYWNAPEGAKNDWEHTTDNEYVVAAFTVKYEMVDYIKKYPDKVYKIYRCNDGEPDKLVKMDFEELLK